MRVLVAVLGLAVLGYGGPAQAAFTTYIHSADFFAALGSAPFYTETFEGPPVNTVLPSGTTLNGITYGFPAGVDGRIGNNYNRIDNQSLEASRFPGDTTGFFFPDEAVTFDFGGPVYAVGIFINIGETASDTDIVLTADGVGAATTGGPGNYDSSTLYFVGLISDTPFTSASLLSTATVSGYNLDNAVLKTSSPRRLGVVTRRHEDERTES
ncbi:MAG: hypothetical protein K2X87_25395, partial [Gemmataceae bacterium]|nr:hypothetical protein [Gemmataceae bacterium]